jgi:hypothetical protein
MKQVPNAAKVATLKSMKHQPQKDSKKTYLIDTRNFVMLTYSLCKKKQIPEK